MTVYQNLNKQRQFNIFGSHTVATQLIKSMLKQFRDVPIMLKNSPIVQAWRHLTLHSLYIEGAGNARLLLLAYAHCSHLRLYRLLLIQHLA